LFDGPILKRVPEKQRGRYSGVRVLINNIGTAVGISLAGMIRANFSDDGILFLMGAVLLLVQFILYPCGFAKYVND
jgi:predicted MFS family arabinose efflux permease